MVGKLWIILMNFRIIIVWLNFKNYLFFKGFKDSKMKFDDNIVLRVFIEYYVYFIELMIVDFLFVL